MSLLGKTALVTGGGTGIGRGIALALAQRGARVVLCGRRPQPLARVAAEVQALGGEAASAPGDVTDAAARQQILAAAHQAFGPVHILVNSAGVLASGALLQLNGPEVERAVATNLLAPIDLTRLFLHDLMYTRGAVVFVGSTASYVPLPYTALYSGTKAGLHAFCSSLRHELAPLGVHLLEAHPPAVATALTASMVHKAPPWLARPHSAEDAGERIVAALAAGRQAVQWGAGERLLISLQRFAPHLLARALHTQRRRFAHAMTPEPAAGEASGKGVFPQEALPASPSSKKPAALPIGDLAAQLAALRAAHPLHECESEGHRWRYIAAGTGEGVVLLLPGALGEADTSFQYIGALQRTHRVLSLDYPSTLDRLGALLAGLDRLLDRLDVAQAHVVGGSYSGLVAQHFAARRPSRVASLLLANTGVPGAAGGWPSLLAAAIERLPEPWLHRAMQAGIPRFLPSSSPAQAFWRGYFATTLPHWSRQALVARLRLFADMQRASEAGVVHRAPYTGPVLIIDAAADRLVSGRERRAMHSLYPQAQHVHFNNKGHVASLDEAAAYISIYQEFLCNLSAPAAG